MAVVVVLGAGIDQLAQLDFVIIASNWGPPLSVQVVEERHEPPDGLNTGGEVSVGRSGLPKLKHSVLVMQGAPRGPPLHSLIVVDERHHSPGPAVMVGPGVSSGRPGRFGKPGEVGLPGDVGLLEKSGGAPVGFGTQ